MSTDDWEDANERESVFREIARNFGGVGEARRILVDLFDADPDMVEEAQSRLVLNGAGRIEGTIALVGGEWEARPECGPQRNQPRRFDRIEKARYWILHGDPDEALARFRETTGGSP